MNNTNRFEPKWVPIWGHVDGQKNREAAVYQAIDAASLCWLETPTGVFDSTKAKEIAEGLLYFINKEDRPLLGLATNKQLLEELQARAEINGWAEYKTYNGKD